MGFIYFTGKSVPQDYPKAAQWFRKAALKGDAQANLVLGLMYLEGKGVPQNNGKAVKFFRGASLQGDAQAQFSLGLIYANGKIVSRNFVEGFKWTTIAARIGKGKVKGYSMKLRNALSKDMTPVKIEKAQRMAKEWLKKYQARKK